MRLKFKNDILTPEDKFLLGIVESRQIVSYEINDQEAALMFKKLPWAKVLITPERYFFRS